MGAATNHRAENVNQQPQTVMGDLRDREIDALRSSGFEVLKISDFGPGRLLMSQ